MRGIDLIYIDSGGGHRAAARAVETAVREQHRPWELRLRSVQDLLDPIDFIRKTTGIPFQDVYNIMLRRGWTRGSAQLIPVMHWIIRTLHRKQVALFERHWRQHPAEMLVSLIPHYNRALRQAFARACPGRPFVTILTDIADYPPNFWIERQEQYLVCGSDRAVEQARTLGIPGNRILRTSGMILNPRFHAPLDLDRAAERKKLGLQPDLPTVLVLFGGEGSNDLVKVARLLNRTALPIQLIVLCGRHEVSLEKLRAMRTHVPMFVEGFTRDVPYYMSLADLFIGKPGPGSISEALAMKLPVIVERNARTLAQERYNADWILEQQVGLVVEDFAGIGEAVGKLLEPDAYAQMRNNAAALRNRAVYEAVECLDSILASHREGTYALPAIPPLSRDFNRGRTML
jgi:1,2-diacylglycerol 3-beta-galactosyltransferase